MDWIADPLDRLQWSLWHFLATIFWAIDRLVLMGAVLIHTLRKWITDPGGIIDLVMSSMLQGEQALSLKTFMAGAILLALMLAAFVFILRPLIGSGHAPVDVRKVFLWLAIAGYLFSTGGAIFTSMEGFRAQLSSSAYQVAATVNGSVGGAGYNNTRGEVPLNSSQPFSPTVQLFPNTTHVYQGSQEYTGIDVAGAFLFATQEDVNGTNNGGTGLPGGFEAQYFINDGTSPWPSNYNADQRRAALNKAITGVIRMGTGIVPSVFAIQQAIIFLALALAAAILIFSLPIALVFAFFTATEVITLSVLRAYVSLLVKTYVTAMILAIFMGFLKFWADSQNWVAFLGMSLLISYFTLQLAHMAVQTITQSLNVVTQAIGQATGTSAMYFDPVKMAGQGVGLAAVAGLAAATGGAALAAGSLVSGMGEMGMTVPGMRTLGFGLAASSRKPGQLASQTLNASNQSATGGATGVNQGAQSLTGPQRANNHLQSLGIPPIQPTSSTARGASGSPSSSVAPTQRLVTGEAAAPPNRVTATSGAPLVAPRTQVLTTPASGTNGSRHPGTSGNGTASRAGNVPSLNGAQVAPPTAAPEIAIAAFASVDSPPLLTDPAVDTGEPEEAPSSELRVRPVKEGGRRMAPILSDIVRGRQVEGMPAATALQNLPRATQQALLGLAERGYRPRDVAAIADAVETVISVLQYQNVPPTSIPKYFLAPDGMIDPRSRGVLDTLEQAGLSGWAGSEDKQRNSDLAHMIGASLQLETTFSGQDVRAAIGRAVSEGGSAETAADHLEVSPAAWGGRYGSVQSAITRAPSFSLNSAEDVQRFMTVAQQGSVEELASGRVAGLDAEGQALLDRVRTRAVEIAAKESGDGDSKAAQAVLERYLRDVRSIPTRVTAAVVPVAPVAPEPPSASRKAPPKEETNQ